MLSRRSACTTLAHWWVVLVIVRIFTFPQSIVDAYTSANTPRMARTIRYYPNSVVHRSSSTNTRLQMSSSGKKPTSSSSTSKNTFDNLFKGGLFCEEDSIVIQTKACQLAQRKIKSISNLGWKKNQNTGSSIISTTTRSSSIRPKFWAWGGADRGSGGSAC